ncbi:MAG: hypothetical protein V3S89_15840 [Desulfobacterales bacterium]
MEEKIVYFEKPGIENTEQVLSLVKERAQARGITKVVLASTRGGTAKAAADAFEGTGIELVIVPWSHGVGGGNPFPPELGAELETRGHRVHFGTMLFHTDELYGTKTPTIMANLLRIFGQGLKVVVEITMMACDGGCVAGKEKIIAVAGTGSGADFAVVMTAAPSLQWTKLRVHEILCKPLMDDAGEG